MPAQRSILFVCTGNVFRSVSAERCFTKYLSDNGVADWTVGSAGIVAEKQSIDPKILETLSEFGINDVEHTQRKLTREMLDENDVVVAMAADHIDFMKTEFNFKDAILFNELACIDKIPEKDSSVQDVPVSANQAEREDFLERTVRYIYEQTPMLFKKVAERFYLFSDLVEGRMTHRNGFPFIILHETPLVVAFMSLDIPFNEDGHVLVIPKKRYRDLANVPDEVAEDMLATIKKVGKAICVDHDGYNVLLNNGLEAGQYIMHIHFHVIPRRSGDGIAIEIWERPKICAEEFIKLNEKLKAQMALL